MTNLKLCVTILAAGNGKRMNSNQPKVLLMIKEEPMLIKIIKVVLNLQPNKIIIIVNNNNITLIKNTIKEYLILTNSIEFVVQDIPLGTGHAILKSINLLKTLKEEGIEHNMILNGDTPCLQSDTLSSIYMYFLNHYIRQTKNLLIVGIKLNDPASNGRIIKSNHLIKIIEYKDCNEQEQKINLINTGIYVVDIDLITTTVPKIKNQNKQNEYYLTDIVELSNIDGHSVMLHILNDSKRIEIFNVNTMDELDYVNNHN